MTFHKAIPVTVVNLYTGTRRRFSTCGKAGECIGVCSTKVAQMAKTGSTYLNWFVYLTGNSDGVEAKITALMAKYRMEGPTIRQREKKTNGGLVSLRIDDKTVIMVTPDKATPEYAEQWRQRHDADRRHTVTHEWYNKNDIIKPYKH